MRRPPTRWLPVARMAGYWPRCGWWVVPSARTTPGRPGPETPDPTTYKNAEVRGPWKRAEPADKDPRGPWWEVFHDPDLNRLETAAAASNQDLRQSARAHRANPRTNAGQVAADFYPQRAEFNPSNMRERTSATT